MGQIWSLCLGMGLVIHLRKEKGIIFAAYSHQTKPIQKEINDSNKTRDPLKKTHELRPPWKRPSAILGTGGAGGADDAGRRAFKIRLRVTGGGGWWRIDW